MTRPDPRMARLLLAAALLRDHSTARLAAARAARAEALAELARLDPPPLDSADAELQRAAQRHAAWAELHRHRLRQTIARQDHALQDLRLVAARAEARCQVLERRIRSPGDQPS